MKYYRVAGKATYDSFEKANAVANEIFQKTGKIVSIELVEKV